MFLCIIVQLNRAYLFLADFDVQALLQNRDRCALVRRFPFDFDFALNIKQISI